MKNLFTYLILSVAISFIGCNSKEVRKVNMTIVVSDKIGNNPKDKLPSDIIELCLPIKICPSYNIVPNPSLERLGFSSGLSLKTDINAGFAGDPKNIIFIENSITKNLNDKEIEDTFSSPNDENVNYYNLLNSYLSNSKHVIFYSSNNSGENYDDYKIYNQLDSVKLVLSKLYCDSNANSVLIVYNPPLQTPTHIYYEKKLEDIKKENEGAKGNPKKLAKVKDNLTKLASKNKNDYRPIYELAKNSVFGREEHHIAFDFLKEAVEIAIDNGEAEALKIDIGNDLARGNENDIWKLANGHANDWEPIMEALLSGETEGLHHDD